MDCSRCEAEEYAESDTFTLQSPGLLIAKKYYDDLYIPELDKSEYESYRLLYKRQFEDYKCIILTKNSNGCKLKSIDFKSVLIEDVRTAVATDSVILDLSITKWNEFENLLYKANYWTLSQPEDNKGIGGRTYLLEGYRPQALRCNKRTYHLILRWSPDPGPIRDVLDTLISYSNFLK